MCCSFVEPDVITYNSVMCACAKGKQFEHALHLLQVMRRSRLEPNVIS